MKVFDCLFKVKPRTLYNYFFYRLLIANQEYLPMKEKLTEIERQIDFRQIGIPRSRPRKFSGIYNLPTDVKQLFSTPKEIAMAICASENAAYFPYANGRVFLDAKYPKAEERKKLRQNIRTMIASVVDSFKVNSERIYGNSMQIYSGNVGPTELDDTEGTAGGLLQN